MVPKDPKVFKRALNKMEGEVLGTVAGEDTAGPKFLKSYKQILSAPLIHQRGKKPGCWLK